MTYMPSDAALPISRGPIRRFIAARLALFGAAGWIGSTYFLQQALRLSSSIVLAWLLAPGLLGTMLLINTLRTAGELLTDVGVGQSIVNNPRGNEPAFYNTAWTIQIARGSLLFALALALTGPIASIYDNPELLALLPAVAPIFLLTGLTSPARFLLQKRLEIRTIALFDLAMAVLGTILQIALAWVMPTIWALVLGLLLSTAASAIFSFFLMDWRSLRLKWEKQSVIAIVGFGKWIFLASLIYFLAMNFDRLYFAGAVPLTLLGVYGIARTFADSVMQLFERIALLLVFPKVSGLIQRGDNLRNAIGPLRLLALSIVAVALAIGIALADQFIFLVYDNRYSAAGFFLTVLLIGTWFGILAAMADSMMMGVGKPASVALGNSAKLTVIVLALPLVLARYGINAALAVFVMAEAGRYTVLVWRKSLIGLSYIRQDIVMTLTFFVLILAFREISFLLGLTDGLGGWFAMAAVSNFETMSN